MIYAVELFTNTPLVVHEISTDNCLHNIARMHGVDDQVRKVKRRKQVGFVQIDDAKICLLADGDLADSRRSARRAAKATNFVNESGNSAATSREHG